MMNLNFERKVSLEASLRNLNAPCGKWSEYGIKNCPVVHVLVHVCINSFDCHLCCGGYTGYFPPELS